MRRRGFGRASAHRLALFYVHRELCFGGLGGQCWSGQRGGRLNAGREAGDRQNRDVIFLPKIDCRLHGFLCSRTVCE